MFLFLLIPILFFLGCQPGDGASDVRSTGRKAVSVEEPRDEKPAHDSATTSADEPSQVQEHDAAATPPRSIKTIRLIGGGVEQTEWRRNLNKYTSTSVILDDGRLFPNDEVKSTDPPLVAIEGITARKAVGIRGETVFIVEGDVVGANVLEQLTGQKVFVSVEGLILQESPGASRGMQCVWEQTGFKQWIASLDRKRLYLIAEPFFQDWALKQSGTLVLIAYCSHLPLKGDDGDSSEHYVVGGAGVDVGF